MFIWPKGRLLRIRPPFYHNLTELFWSELINRTAETTGDVVLWETFQEVGMTSTQHTIIQSRLPKNSTIPWQPKQVNVCSRCVATCTSVPLNNCSQVSQNIAQLCLLLNCDIVSLTEETKMLLDFPPQIGHSLTLHISMQVFTGFKVLNCDRFHSINSVAQNTRL